MATNNKLSGYRPTEKEHFMLQIMSDFYGLSMSKITGLAVRSFFKNNGFSLLDKREDIKIIQDVDTSTLTDIENGKVQEGMKRLSNVLIDLSEKDEKEGVGVINFGR